MYICFIHIQRQVHLAGAKVDARQEAGSLLGDDIYIYIYIYIERERYI